MKNFWTGCRSNGLCYTWEGMPVQLDWEIDDAETQPPAVSREAERRLSGCRRWGRRFALIALAVTVGLGFLALRIRQKKNEIENEVRALVQLELNALINGDQDLFQSRQDPEDPRWQRAQEQAFNDYHRYSNLAPWQDSPQHFQYTGQVPIVDVEQHQARAHVEVTRGGRTWRELWFYEWTEADGWNRVRFDESWLGEQQALTTVHLRFTYPEQDATAVHALANDMEAWLGILATLLGVRLSGAPLLTVQFDHRNPTYPQSLEMRWVRNSFELLAPSPHQVSADGDLSPDMRGELAGYLVEALIAQQTGLQPSETLGPVIKALRDELRDWAVARIADEASDTQVPDASDWTALPTPLLDAVVAHDGVQVIPLLVANLGKSQTLDEVLASAGLDPPEPALRLAFHLTAVHRVFHHLDEMAFRTLLDPNADRNWREYYMNELRSRRNAVQAGYFWPALSSLQIKSVVFNDTIAWVETQSTQEDGATYHQTHFLRLVDDRWLLTSPDPAYFGARRTTRTENLVFDYFECEAEWFEERVPVALQALFSKAATELGIPTDGLVVTMQTELQPGIDGWMSEGGRHLRYSSPCVIGWPVDRLDDQVLELTVPLISVLFETRMQNTPQEDPRYVLVHIGALLWELKRLFPERADWTAWLPIDASTVPLTSLEEMWESLATDPNEDEFEREQLWVGYHVLFEYLVESYGPAVVPLLLDNVGRTDDLDEWLRLSTGDGLDQIQPAWQAWIRDRYGEP